MTSHQCGIAAESYSACLLAQAGYDVFIQYGANQPDYDLVANKESRFLPISVKGSQNGNWALAGKYKKGDVSYHDAIDQWLEAQRPDIVFLFVQFFGVPLGGAPRAYIAQPPEIAAHLKTQRQGRGHGALHEDCRMVHPKSTYDHRIPAEWVFTQARIGGIEL